MLIAGDAICPPLWDVMGCRSRFAVTVIRRKGEKLFWPLFTSKPETIRMKTHGMLKYFGMSSRDERHLEIGYEYGY